MPGSQIPILHTHTYGGYEGRCCCCCCFLINSHKIRGHRTGSSDSGAEELPQREKHRQTRGGRRNSCLRQKHIKRETGSQSTMCQVHTGANVSPLIVAPGKTDYLVYCLPSKTDYYLKYSCTTYILHVIRITTNTYACQTRCEKKKRTGMHTLSTSKPSAARARVLIYQYQRPRRTTVEQSFDEPVRCS